MVGSHRSELSEGKASTLNYRIGRDPGGGNPKMEWLSCHVYVDDLTGQDKGRAYVRILAELSHLSFF
jgi:hypothetical protein